MKLTTRGRYAVTAMLDLAIHGGEDPITLADISARQEISLSYLEQLFSKLRREDLFGVSEVRAVAISSREGMTEFLLHRLSMRSMNRLTQQTVRAAATVTMARSA